MGNAYKYKKSKGCALCKPHKHGWAPKKKVKERTAEMELARLVGSFMDDPNRKIYVRDVIERGLADSKAGQAMDVRKVRAKYGLPK